MWTYEQATGWLVNPAGTRIAQGYSGYGDYKNDPNSENLKSLGPIPRGTYDFEAPADTVTHGPFVLRLDPKPENEMFGRSGFLVHGDSVVHPGTASEGCIIQPRFAREAMWNSDDHTVEVV